MQFVQNSKNPKALGDLYSYLQERPGSLIDFKKIQRFLGINFKLTSDLFLELEQNDIGSLVKAFKNDHFSIKQTPHGKFYFHDLKHLLDKSHYRQDQSGALFEQTFFIQLKNKISQIWFMRTLDDIEVDFIIETNSGELWALELQTDQFIYAADLQGLHFFHKNFPAANRFFVLHMGTRDNREGIVEIVPYQKLLDLLT